MLRTCNACDGRGQLPAGAIPCSACGADGHSFLMDCSVCFGKGWTRCGMGVGVMGAPVMAPVGAPVMAPVGAPVMAPVGAPMMAPYGAPGMNPGVIPPSYGAGYTSGYPPRPYGY